MDLTEAPDGTHALEVRAVDGVGNFGPVAVAAFELDRVAPEPITFTTTPLSPGNDAAPTWALDFEPGTLIHCRLDGAHLGAACGLAIQVALETDGLHVLEVWLTDDAGNISPVTTSEYLLDRVAPDAPIVTPPASPARERQPTWAIQLLEAAATECVFDDGRPEACGALYSPAAPLRDGTHTLVVTARDAAGNVSAPVTTTYLLDTVAPTAPLITHTPGPSGWHWAFRVEVGARPECSTDGDPWASCTSPHPGGSPGRPVRFEVRAIDKAGNRSAITAVTVTPASPASSGKPAPFASPPAPRTAPGSGRSVTTPPAPEAPAKKGDATGRPLGIAIAPEIVDGVTATVETSGVIGRRIRQPEGFFGNPVRELLQAAAERTTIPVLVVVVVLTFLAAQNRIDRRDPKLANAPLRQEPEYMEFE